MNQERPDPRTDLSLERTVFAAERTYAAWVRTGLAALASGVGARGFLEGIIHETMTLFAATVLMVFSAFCFWAAIWRELHPGVPSPPADTPYIPRLVLIGVNGCLILVAFGVLVGMWLVR